MNEKPQKFYSMEVRGREADIYIFGYILTPDWAAFQRMFGDNASRSGYDIMTEIRALDVDVINVHINSYGGHVSEGLAIHNVLVEHKAKIRTVDDGFACSAASVVFMAGTIRVMHAASLLMIHNAWGGVEGNADQLRKYADDLEAMSRTAAQAYKAKINISDEELDKLLKNESWITPEDALKWGFATEIWQPEQDAKPAASAMSALMRVLTEPQATPMPNADAFEQMRQDIAAIKAAISLPKASEPEPQQEPQQEPKPEPQEEPAKEQEKKPIDFLNALLGGKDNT